MSAKFTPKVLSDGTKVWYGGSLGVHIHREDGPAVEMADGTKYWYREGKIHRADGPAVEYSTGIVEFWNDGAFERRQDGAGKVTDTPETLSPPSSVTLAGRLSHILGAMKNCQTSGNTEWLQRHRSRLLFEMEKAFGEADITLSEDKSTAEKLVFVIGRRLSSSNPEKPRLVTVTASFGPGGVEFTHTGRHKVASADDKLCEDYAELLCNTLPTRVSRYDDRPVAKEQSGQTLAGALSNIAWVMDTPREVPEEVKQAVLADAGRAGWLQDYERSDDVVRKGLRFHAEKIVKDRMPAGGGFDSGTKIDCDHSSQNKLVFTADFHHMNDGGYYDGWTDHAVTVTPSFVSGLTIEIGGRDRNEIKDFIHEAFQLALSEPYQKPTAPQQQVEARVERTGIEDDDEQQQGVSR